MSSGAAAHDLARLLGDPARVVAGDALAPYLDDATEARGVRGRADAAVLPRDADEVAAVVAWCDAHDVPMTPRGGGSGFAGGSVPDGGVVIALGGLRELAEPEPGTWRVRAGAGATTAHVRRRARESGLYYPVDPGAAESSQIGGNVATNAGGPHAFKHGVTGRWVTGLEAVLPSGEPIALGGTVRKDVAGYDLRSLLIGSEGTLAIVTAVWLRLIPAPEAELPVVGWYPDATLGAAAIEAALTSGVTPAAVEYLDRTAMRIAAPSFPLAAVPDGFAVIVAAEGSAAEVAADRDTLVEALDGGALAVHAPTAAHDVRELWRWRDGVSLAVTAELGGKVSEDVAVPVDRLAEAVDETQAIATRHGLRGCSWGHAGDGNLHSTFLVARDDEAALRSAAAASGELMEMAIRLGGTISGEHGIGTVKNGHLSSQWPAAAVALHGGVKRLFDPKGLLNPGKKVA